MKYAFMSFSCPKLGLDAFLAAAAHYGYEGVEPRIACGHQHGIELAASPVARRAARRTAEKSGIALCCLATSCSYANPATSEAQVAETLRAIDLAGDVGSPRLRVFGGKIPDGVSRDQAMESVVRSLQGVADRAAARGVTVCMETHDSWCDPAHVAEVMRRVNHPAVAVNWDIMHPVRVAGATMDAAFAALRPWVRHVHFHDGKTEKGKLVFTPIGTGEVDHRRAVALLKGVGYEGFLSGEWIDWEPYESHLPCELATMRRYEQESG